MKIHSAKSLAWSAAALTLGWLLSAPLLADEPAAKSPDDPAPAAVGAGKKGMLDKGMAAADIVRLIGEPTTVTKLKMEKVKAEKWVYRKLVGHQVEQVAASVENTPAFIGTAGQGANDLGTRPEIQYTLKHISTYQVTALLMINDRLDLAKQWTERQVSYDQ